MIQVTQRDVDYVRLRYNDLLTEAARARLIADANEPSPSPAPRKVFHISAYLRQAVASLVAPASIG